MLCFQVSCIIKLMLMVSYKFICYPVFKFCYLGRFVCVCVCVCARACTHVCVCVYEFERKKERERERERVYEV